MREFLSFLRGEWFEIIVIPVFLTVAVRTTGIAAVLYGFVAGVAFAFLFSRTCEYFFRFRHQRKSTDNLG